mmetsp:Transcript_988/g.1244  ORF Transcript_988/g.1244 Transcript_988/m.1244 type:complete len:214 (+) Transcript_988:60-701(+)
MLVNHNIHLLQKKSHKDNTLSDSPLTVSIVSTEEGKSCWNSYLNQLEKHKFRKDPRKNFVVNEYAVSDISSNFSRATEEEQLDQTDSVSMQVSSHNTKKVRFNDELEIHLVPNAADIPTNIRNEIWWSKWDQILFKMDHRLEKASQSSKQSPEQAELLEGRVQDSVSDIPRKAHDPDEMSVKCTENVKSIPFSDGLLPVPRSQYTAPLKFKAR